MQRSEIFMQKKVGWERTDCGKTVVACTGWFHHGSGGLGYGTSCMSQLQCDVCTVKEVTQCRVCFSLWTQLCSAQDRTNTVTIVTVLHSWARATTLNLPSHFREESLFSRSYASRFLTAECYAKMRAYMCLFWTRLALNGHGTLISYQ